MVVAKRDTPQETWVSDLHVFLKKSLPLVKPNSRLMDVKKEKTVPVVKHTTKLAQKEATI